MSVYKLPGQDGQAELQQEQKQEQPAQQQDKHLQQTKPSTPAKQQQQQQAPGTRRSMDKEAPSPYRAQSTPTKNSSREGSQRGYNTNDVPMANGNAALVSIILH